MSLSTIQDEAAKCPLCGGPNDCQLCTTSVYKGHCWCFTAEVPQSLLDSLPAEVRRKSCLCRKCIESAKSATKQP